MVRPVVVVEQDRVNNLLDRDAADVLRGQEREREGGDGGRDRLGDIHGSRSRETRNAGILVAAERCVLSAGSESSLPPVRVLQNLSGVTARSRRTVRSLMCTALI